MPRAPNRNTRPLAPQISRSQALADRFSEWEQNIGRGWSVFDHETDLEPPFLRIPAPQSFNRPFDDGRIPSRLGRLFSTRPATESLSQSDNHSETLPSRTLRARSTKGRKVSYRIHIPSEAKIAVPQTEQLISSLAFSASFISFEIIGSPREIILQIMCRDADQDAVLSQFKSHLPGIDLRLTEDALPKNLQSSTAGELLAVDFGLRSECFIPLPFGKEFSTETLIPLVASFEGLNDGESACLQVLFSRTLSSWKQIFDEALFDRVDKPSFANLQNISSLIKEKLSNPLLAVCIRLLAKSDSAERSMQIARQAGSYFKQFARGGRNELIPLRNDQLDASRHTRSIFERTTFRSGMLLTPQELSAIVHLPSDAVKSEKLGRDKNQTKRAPAIATEGTIILGENEHAGRKQIIRVSPATHAILTGGTGTGKSTLKLQMMLQTLALGGGFCAVDPHGDLVDDLIMRIPDDRRKDVILFDAADSQFPIGFNILQANSETEKTFLASDLVATFRRFSTSWGDVMDSVLANAVLAFVESSRGGTLFDLKRFLVEKEFRRDFLETVKDDAIRYFWINEFPQITGRTQSSILIRLDTFLRQKLIRNIVCQRESGLNLRRIFDEKKILLVKLAQGLIGEENAALLGTLLISKIYQIALTRQDVDPTARAPFTCYIDEAAHFAGNPSMALILANLRKFGVNLTLSIQSYKQLMSRDANIADSVLTNCSTRICFRLGDTDAERFAGGFSSFDARALQNLGRGEAIMRIERAENDFNLKTYPPEPVSPELAEQRKAAIIKQTREIYATPIAQVEDQFSLRNTAAGFAAGKKPSPPLKAETREVPANTIIPQPGDPAPVAEASSHQIPTGFEQGRGGEHHQELQSVIKRMAESYGFQAEIEKVLPDGGRVDVSLENDEYKLACEVSVTTVDYEITNVLKCLEAGYDYALVVVSNQKKLPLLNTKLCSAVPMEHHDQVKAFGLSGLLGFLRELVAPKEIYQKRAEKPPGQRLNFTDACEFFGVGTSTLYRWIREGRVPFYRPGREYQFDRDELVLIGKHDLSGKRKASIKLSPLNLDKKIPKGKKEKDSRYRKLLKLD